MKKQNIITAVHTSTKRQYIQRMRDEKIACMKKAREFEFDFWDGDRRFGYGGYNYDGRWKSVAEKLITAYHLTNDSSVLDIGCGKAHLLYEIKELLPGCTICGIDVSKYAIEHAMNDVQQYLTQKDARQKLSYRDNAFDLVISLNTLHNFQMFDLKVALQEMDRVAKNKYLVVEAYDTEEQLFNLQCWALTCESFFSTKEWLWLYDEFGYSGDYEFIYFD